MWGPPKLGPIAAKKQKQQQQWRRCTLFVPQEEIGLQQTDGVTQTPFVRRLIERSSQGWNDRSCWVDRRLFTWEEMRRGGPKQDEWRPASPSKKVHTEFSHWWRNTVDQGCFCTEVTTNEVQCDWLMSRCDWEETGKFYEQQEFAACDRSQLFLATKLSFLPGNKWKCRYCCAQEGCLVSFHLSLFKGSPDIENAFYSFFYWNSLFQMPYFVFFLYCTPFWVNTPVGWRSPSIKPVVQDQWPRARCLLFTSPPTERWARDKNHSPTTSDSPKQIEKHNIIIFTNTYWLWLVGSADTWCFPHMNISMHSYRGWLTRKQENYHVSSSQNTLRGKIVTTIG